MAVSLPPGQLEWPAYAGARALRVALRHAGRGRCAVHYAIHDAASRNYLTPTTSPVHFDPAAWQATLERMLAVRPAHVFLTHYSRIDAVAELADDLRTGLAAYQRIARTRRRPTATRASTPT